MDWIQSNKPAKHSTLEKQQDASFLGEAWFFTISLRVFESMTTIVPAFIFVCVPAMLDG